MRTAFILVLAIIALAFATPEKDSRGYYKIATVSDLDWLSDTLNLGGKCPGLNAVLEADLDYEGGNWIPLCAGKGEKPFSGVFDGKGHTISNLVIDGSYLGTINKAYQQNLGFVGALSGRVTDLNLANIYVISVARGGTIATGDAIEKAIGVGTLVGWMNATAKVDGSYVSGTMHAFGYGQAIGGVVGNSWGLIENTISTVSIVADSMAYVGGIAGYTKKTASIRNVVWNGQVIDNKSSGDNGGIVGYVYNGTLTVENTMYNSNAIDTGIGKTGPGVVVSEEPEGVADLNTGKTACKLNGGTWTDDSGCSVTDGKWYVGLDGLQVGGYHEDYGILTVVEHAGERVGILNGSYRPAVQDGVFTEPVTVDSLVFARTFVSGQNSTLCLPFSIPTENIGGLELYKLSDVGTETVNDSLVYTVYLMPETDGIVAGRPYIVIPTDTVLTISGGPFTLGESHPGQDISSDGLWTLSGVYTYTVGADLPNRAASYGFSAKAADGFKAGEFVKVGTKGYFYPFRVFLTHSDGFSLAKGNVENEPAELPDRISVVIDKRDTVIPVTHIGSDSIQVIDRTEEFQIDRPSAIFIRKGHAEVRTKHVRLYDLLGRFRKKF